MNISYQKLIKDSEEIGKKLVKNKYDSVYGIPIGGLIPAFIISRILKVPLVGSPLKSKKTLIVDDLIDSGETLNKFKGYNTLVLYRKFYSPKTTYFLKEIKGWAYLPHEKFQTGIEDHITRILEFIGENPKREGLIETPKRVSKMYEEIFYGLKTKPPEFKLFKSSNDQMVVKTFDCYSICEHHLTPILMKIIFGYIPHGQVVGISKIIRRVKWWAARPVIQEDFTEQVIDDFNKELKPLGVMFIVKGRHFCELLRGVKTDSWTITSEVRGVFEEASNSREELLKLVKL